MKKTSFQIVKLPTGKFTYAKPPPTLLQYSKRGLQLTIKFLIIRAAHPKASVFF